MKKLILFLAAFILMATTCKAACLSNPIELQSSIIDPTSQHDGQHKGFVPVPQVSIDNHTLYFGTPCDGCLLNIVDENNIVVYTTVIPTGTTLLVIPSSLSGEYELQIVIGNYLFYGNICLP